MIDQWATGCAAWGESSVLSRALPFNPTGKETDMEWKDQYKHPNWQKKRLEVLEAAAFVCEKCYDSESQLHVHHKRYVKGRKIWEYAVHELFVLCDSCHEIAHQESDLLQTLLAKLHVDATSEVFSLICGYVEVVNGPAGWIEGGDVGPDGLRRVEIFNQSDSPLAHMSGRLAGLSSNRLNFEVVSDVCNFLLNGNEGDSITVTIPARVRFEDS